MVWQHLRSEAIRWRSMNSPGERAAEKPSGLRFGKELGKPHAVGRKRSWTSGAAGVLWLDDDIGHIVDCLARQTSMGDGVAMLVLKSLRLRSALIGRWCLRRQWKP